MKGVYALIIQISKQLTLTTGGLGKLTLEKGAYVYVGSALGIGSTSLENRLGRHFSDTKTIHWHIDYLLDMDVEIESAVWARTDETMECDLAQSIKSSDDFEQGPPGFGASDCKRNCGTHLFRQTTNQSTADILDRIFKKLGLQPHIAKGKKFPSPSK
ncbi:MAG: GIY-YIG nuclease family protein [Candidatus Thorarchaeota archaeon]